MRSVCLGCSLNWTNYELKQQTGRCKGKGSVFVFAYVLWMCGTDVWDSCGKPRLMVCLLRVLTQLLLRGPVRARLTFLGCGQHSPLWIICSHLPQSGDGSYFCPFSRGFLFQRRCERFPQKYQKKTPFIPVYLTVPASNNRIGMSTASLPSTHSHFNPGQVSAPLLSFKYTLHILWHIPYVYIYICIY